MSFRSTPPDADPQPDTPDPYAVPEHLRPYYDKARGPDPHQLALARAGVEGAVPREIELRPPGTGPGPRDEYRRLRDVDVDTWVHETRLQQAQAKYEGAERATAVKAMAGRCDLCNAEAWPASNLTAITTADGRQLRLCAGDCHDTIALELHRRRWQSRIDELLDD